MPSNAKLQRHLGVGVEVEEAQNLPSHAAEKHRAKAHDIPRGRILRHGLARGDERLRAAHEMWRITSVASKEAGRSDFSAGSQAPCFESALESSEKGTHKPNPF